MKPVNGLICSTCYQGQSAKQFDGRSEVSSDRGRKVQLKPVGGLQPFWEGTQLPRHQRHCGAHRVGLFHTLHIREREGETIGLTTFPLCTNKKMKNQTLVYGSLTYAKSPNQEINQKILNLSYRTSYPE